MPEKPKVPVVVTMSIELPDRDKAMDLQVAIWKLLEMHPHGYFSLNIYPSERTQV